MAGLETATGKLDSVAQNLSNTNTQGYAAMETVAMALPFKGEAAEPGADVISLAEGTNTANGTLQRTGNPFDVAVNGGWLVVKTTNGGEALTRNGALSQAANGFLSTQTGEPVVGVGGAPISLPILQKIEISQDGTISGILAGAATQQPQVYGRLMIASSPANGQLTPLGNSLYSLSAGGQPVVAPNAVVEQGYLEGSNVNSVSAMISMINATKSFQLQTQLVQASAKTETALDQVMTA